LDTQPEMILAPGGTYSHMKVSRRGQGVGAKAVARHRMTSRFRRPPPRETCCQE
jgi:hypothetical protein